MRAFIYDAMMVRLTTAWYKAVLERLTVGARVLDVGIGTGSALLKNRELVVERDLRIVGLDINQHYVEKCRNNIARSGLEDRIGVRLESIDEHYSSQPYDAVYFSASFMLMGNPKASLQHVSQLLNLDGRIYFTQTFQDRPSAWFEYIKPRLRLATTIDFGQVTYEQDFQRVMSEANIDLTTLETLSRSSSRSTRLAIGKPINRLPNRLRGSDYQN